MLKNRNNLSNFSVLHKKDNIKNCWEGNKLSPAKYESEIWRELCDGEHAEH